MELTDKKFEQIKNSPGFETRFNAIKIANKIEKDRKKNNPRYCRVDYTVLAKQQCPEDLDFKLWLKAINRHRNDLKKSFKDKLLILAEGTRKHVQKLKDTFTYPKYQQLELFTSNPA